MSIKEKVDNYIKDIAKDTAHAVYDEMQPQQECYDGFSLPEIDRNKMLAMSIQKTHKDIKAAVSAGVAMDACCDTSKFSSFYNITNPVDDIIYTHFATQGFIGFQACALLCQNWLINKACTLPPKDAIRPDYELSYVTEADAENLDKDFLAKITNISNDPKGYNIKKVCKLFAEKKRQYGQVLAYPIVEGADYSNPFNIDGITPDSYKGMTVIDPIWYVGELVEEAINDPTSLRYFKPTYFRMPNGVKIHHSWCIFGITSEVPDVLKPTYFWGGYPIPQLIYKRVYAAEKTANEAPMLAMSKRLLVADINVQGYLANPQKTDEQLKAISMFRDNYGVMTKRPGDSVQQIDTSLTDLDEVIMTQYQLVAAAANIPATKLLETQPKGFNSTGDYEDDQYKLLLTSIQEDDYVPLLNFHYALLSKSKYDIVRDYTINFSEIDTPTEKERAEINSMEAQTAAVLVNAGVISPDEVRNKLIKNPDSGFNDIEDDLPEDDEPFNFGEEEQEGNGETPQNPFSMDETDEWFTVHPNGKEHEGRPVYAEGGENKADAIKRRFGDKPKKKNKNQTSSSNPKDSRAETEKHLGDGGYQIKNITSENHQALNNALNNAQEKFGFNKITAINSIDDLDAYAQVNPDLSISINQNLCEYDSDNIKKYYDYEITNFKENTAKRIENDKKLIERGLKSAERDLKRHKRMAEFERFGVHSTPDKFFEETITHELGHLILKQRILDAYEKDRAKAYELDKLITDSYKKAKKDKDIYKISYVADEDEQEYFAECFVAYNAGEKLPDHAKNMIETFMKKQ